MQLPSSPHPSAAVAGVIAWRPADPSRAVVLALSLLAVAACGAGVAALGVSTSQFLLCAISLSLLLPIGWRLITGRVDVFEPIYLFALGWTAMFVIRPIAILASNDFAYVRVSQTIDIEGSFNRMLLLALLGSVAFVVGYTTRTGRTLARRAPTPSTQFDTGTLVTASIGLIVVSLCLYAVFLHSTVGLGNIGEMIQGRSHSSRLLQRSSTGYLYSAPLLLIPASVVLLAVARERKQLVAAVLAISTLALLLALTVPVGSRTALLPLVGASIVYFYLSRGSRPRFGAVVVLLVAALFSSSLLLTTRQAGPDQPSLPQAAAELVADPMTVFEPITQGEDAAMAPLLAAALTVVPSEMDHMYGEAVVGDFFTRPIPRILWAEKPIAPRERVIQQLYPEQYAARVANPEFSVLLVFFLDASYVGVVVGMFIFGLITKTLYEYMLLHSESMLVRAGYALLLPFIVGGVRDSPVDTFIRMVFAVFPLFVIFLVSAIRSKPSDHHAMARVNNAT